MTVKPLPVPKRPDRKSIVYISMHKAGSTVHSRLLKTYADVLGLVWVDFEEDQKDSPIEFADYVVQHARQMREMGYLFGPLRGNYLQRLGNFSENRVIIQVRDPRDCLVSWHYSMGWSHSPPKDPDKHKQFLERRKYVQSLSIDQHVLEMAPDYASRLENIAVIADNHKDHLLLRYEDMVQKTPEWLSATDAFLNIERDDRLTARQSKYLDFKVSAEQRGAHKRQVTPGDHKRKLKQATIERLNETLEYVLDRFGYIQQSQRVQNSAY